MFLNSLLFFSFLASCNCFSFHGSTKPLGLFDPFKFMDNAPPTTLARYRESELKHGRWAMIAAASIPLIESETHRPAIHEFDKLPSNIQLGIVWLILMGEVSTMLKGWENPFINGTSNYFKLKPDYQPGDVGIELSNHDDVEFHDKELNNGRLAMIAFAGIVAQELISNQVLIPSSPI